MLYTMKSLILILLSLIIVFNANSQQIDRIIPVPVSVEQLEGEFEFNESTTFVVQNEEQLHSAKFLSEIFQSKADVKISKARKMKNVVAFKTNKDIKAEGYRLSVNSNRILIEASNSSGYFYAIQTLRQLLPKSFYANRNVLDQRYTIPAVNIDDAPRFSYRGFMLDVSRFFMPKKEILKLLDMLALHKINYFHWHLVDDNGWRIQIKKYPRLTDIGAWRPERHNYFSMRANPVPGEPATNGGYYTQEDIQEIVKYASERCIEVIPEIEMPAHTISSLAAYPHLACPVAEHPISVLPGIGGTKAADIYCAGNDSVYAFLEDVLTEVISLFPSEYIHIGGDEAQKSNWKKCPKCQKLMKEHNIPNEEELQSFFIKRINRFLKTNNRKLMGWDELVDSEIPDGATIFGWRGMGDAAEKAGKQGFNYIKSPAQKYYFIRYQGPQWFEPFTYFGTTSLRDVYEYEPQNANCEPEVKNRMLGVEACLWTEFVQHPREAEYLIFPRLAAFAETAWSKAQNKKWTDFISGLDELVKIYDYYSINYAKSMYNLQHCVKPYLGRLELSLSSIRSDLDIRYTTDGSEPKANSTLFNTNLVVEAPALVRAATFSGSQRMGTILPLKIIKHKGIGAKIHSKDPVAYVLVNGIRGSEKRSDGEWANYYDSDTEFVIELPQATHCSTIKVGLFNDSGMSVHLPAEINVKASLDNVSYQQIANVKFAECERFQSGIFNLTKELSFTGTNYKFIKFEIKKPGLTPANHVHGVKPCYMSLDEIIIE